MTRTGKIARLPRDIRHQLNRRLQDGELQTHSVEWLNSLPEVQAVLKAEFDERPISEQNLSEWKTGGYRDWVLQQDTLELLGQMADDGEELKQAVKEPLTDKLALWVAARYIVATKALSAAEGEESWRLLREFCGDIVALRKGDHSAERLKLERERLEHERELDHRDVQKLCQKWAEEHRDEICQGYKTRDEVTAELIKAMFGDEDEDEPETSGETKLPDSPCASDPPAPTESNQIKPDQT